MFAHAWVSRVSRFHGFIGITTAKKKLPIIILYIKDIDYYFKI